MKKTIIFMLFSLVAGSLFAFGGVSDPETATGTLETGSWTNIYDIESYQYEGLSVLFQNNSAGSIYAYRLRTYLYPDTSAGQSITIIDSTRITGVSTDLIEYNPNVYGRILIDIINVSESVNYQVDYLQKNPSD